MPKESGDDERVGDDTIVVPIELQAALEISIYLDIPVAPGTRGEMSGEAATRAISCAARRELDTTLMAAARALKTHLLGRGDRLASGLAVRARVADESARSLVAVVPEGWEDGE